MFIDVCTPPAKGRRALPILFRRGFRFDGTAGPETRDNTVVQCAARVAAAH